MAASVALIAAWPLACVGPAAASALRREDALWLERVAFGADSASIAQFRDLGRERFLDRQLAARGGPPPPAASADSTQGSRSDLAQILAGVEAERKVVRGMPSGIDKIQARKSYIERGNEIANRASRDLLWRAVQSPARLEEQMVWFWLNHFSVYQRKAELRWLIGDYTDQAIRPHVFGRFRDLVLATLEHPAMLEYLDNTHNRAGHVNENYARELLELHTLGVESGYTQGDVQQLALALTGVGIYTGGPRKFEPDLERWYRHEGGFEFNPAHHDFSAKILLGRPLEGRGFDEVEEAVALIVRQPACAHFVARKLAAYFVADDPPPRLIEKMARTFSRTDGDIAQVLRTMFLAPEFDAALGAKFKDPMRFAISAVRLAYDGRSIDDTGPMLTWLRALGEAPFERQTPDGYALTEVRWASSGQISRRFEIARTIGNSVQLSSRLYAQTLEPFLGPHTRAALAQAASPSEWNAFLLSSPEFNYE